MKSNIYLGLWLGIKILRQKFPPQDREAAAKIAILEAFVEELLFETLLEELKVEI